MSIPNKILFLGVINFAAFILIFLGVYTYLNQEGLLYVNNILFTYIGGTLLFLLILLYFLIRLYFETKKDIQSLLNSTKKISQGHFNKRVELNSQPDLQHVENSIYNIADNLVSTLNKLGETENRLQAIISSSMDAIIQINTDEMIIGWSPQAEKMFGWAEDEAIGQSFHLIIIPDKFREIYLKNIHKKTKKALKLRFELFALYRDCYEFPIELSISSVKSSHNIKYSLFIRNLTNQRKAEELLRILSQAVEQSPSSISITDKHANIEYVNKTLLRNTGYSLDELLGNNILMLAADKMEKESYDAMINKLAHGEAWQGEMVSKCKNGKEFTELAHISPVRKENGGITHYLAIKEDITEKKKAIVDLQIAAVAFESNEGIIITDAKNVILRVNRAFTSITGYSPNEVIGRTPAIFSSGRHDKQFYDTMWASIRETGTWQGEIWNRRRNGDEYPERLTITAIKNEKGTPTHYIAIFSDITHSKAAEEKIKFLAYFDPLTQLPNRRKLFDRLDHCIAMSHRDNTELAVLMLDLDRFKAVNDNFGHLAGDELLSQVASRISLRIRSTDLVARLGGDEFVVLVENINHSEDTAKIAESIVADLSQPFQLTHPSKVTVEIGTSIGISLYPQHAKTSASLMDYADLALYQAKDKGRGCYAFFSEQLTQTVQKRLALEIDLRKAIKNNELSVHYQPQVNVLSGKTVGAEALVRWQKDDQLIPPNDFIPFAEETGLIIELGEWVLQETCRQGRIWQQAGMPLINLAVNVSPYQFNHCNMDDLVVKTLAKTKFPGHKLELELTESGLMENPKEAEAILNKLQKIGVRLAIDDFGTGYSSLAHLKRFPVDILKIDKSFIDDIPDDKHGIEIATTIIAMAHALGFEVLAEGVETKEQLEFLKSKGCNSYQGYFKSKPLPADQFAELFLKQTISEDDTPLKLIKR